MKLEQRKKKPGIRDAIGLTVWEGSVYALLLFALLLSMRLSGMMAGIILGSGLFLLCLLRVVRALVPEKTENRICPVVSGCLLVLLFAVPGAAGAVADRLLVLVCRVWPRIYPHFGSSSGDGILLTGLLLFAGLLAVGCSLLLENGRGWQEKLVVFLLLIFFACMEKAFPFGGKVVFLGGVFFLAVHAWMKKGRFLSADLYGNGILQAGLLALILLAGAGLVYGLRGDQLAEEPSAVTAFRKTAQKKVDSFRYGTRDTGMPEGDLSEWKSLALQEDPMLEISMEEPDSYYLRGFVGETYEDAQWSQLDGNERYSSSDLFYWLHRDGFYGQSQLSRAASQTLTDPVQDQTMTVNNLQADSRWLYLPYEVEDPSVLPSDGIGDMDAPTTGLHGQREYSAGITEPLVTRGAEMLAGLDEADSEYQTEEAHYNEYVYRTELQIPDALRQILQEELGEVTYPQGQKHADYGEARQSILYYLTSYCTYSEDAQSYTGDPLVWFLKEGHTGYSVQYASAAVMIFRYFGIPARYVEGYLVTPGDVDGVSAGETVTITEKNAHAWAEYYQDGIGWLPFEATPAYLGVMPSPQAYESLSDSTGAISTRENEDDSQQEEESQQEEPELRDYLLAVLIAVIVLLALLLIAFLIWLVAGRIHAGQRRKSFDDPDPVRGIDNMFRYVMQMLFLLGVQKRSVDLELYEPKIRAALGDALAEEYVRVWMIRRKGLFSGRGSSEAERRQVKEFCGRAYKHMMKKASLTERFAYKFLYFM